MDYDFHHCLFNMLYVLWLAIFSNSCRGGGGCCYLIVHNSMSGFDAA